MTFPEQGIYRQSEGFYRRDIRYPGHRRNAGKTRDGQLCSAFHSGVLGLFAWIDGENVETDETKTPEYQLLCRIYSLTKPGFPIPSADFSAQAASRFYESWDKLKSAPKTRGGDAILSVFEQHKDRIAHCASRLSHFASVCQRDTGDFYFTHGDAGGNFFIGHGKHYIVDWDEVMYAPLERDAWVMCCHAWARELFDNTLREHGIAYQLRPERLAFYCYHMFFFYLDEFMECLPFWDMSERVQGYLEDGWIEERTLFADTI